jgi:hypothetical protein
MTDNESTETPWALEVAQVREDGEIVWAWTLTVPDATPLRYFNGTIYAYEPDWETGTAPSRDEAVAAAAARKEQILEDRRVFDESKEVLSV